MAGCRGGERRGNQERYENEETIQSTCNSKRFVLGAGCCGRFGAGLGAGPFYAHHPGAAAVDGAESGVEAFARICVDADFRELLGRCGE